MTRKVYVIYYGLLVSVIGVVIVVCLDSLLLTRNVLAMLDTISEVYKRKSWMVRQMVLA